MWWRLTRSQFEQQKGEPNRQALKAIVDSGKTPGILAYQEDQPVAWCAIAPREEYPVLARSRILKPIDNKSVWSLVCLFVPKPFRRKGLSARLIQAAVDFAKEQGASIIEGYPIDTDKDRYPDAFAYTGFYPVFKELGFEECIRRSETRPIMRLTVQKK